MFANIRNRISSGWTWVNATRGHKAFFWLEVLSFLISILFPLYIVISSGELRTEHLILVPLVMIALLLAFNSFFAASILIYYLWTLAKPHAQGAFNTYVRPNWKSIMLYFVFIVTSVAVTPFVAGKWQEAIIASEGDWLSMPIELIVILSFLLTLMGIIGMYKIWQNRSNMVTTITNHYKWVAIATFVVIVNTVILYTLNVNFWFIITSNLVWIVAIGVFFSQKWYNHINKDVVRWIAVFTLAVIVPIYITAIFGINLFALSPIFVAGLVAASPFIISAFNKPKPTPKKQKKEGKSIAEIMNDNMDKKRKTP